MPKRSRNLSTHEIGRVIQATLSLVILRAKPVLPNYRKQYLALGDLIVHDLCEIHSKSDIVHVKKQGLAPKRALQPIPYEAGGGRAVITTIAEEHLRLCAHGSAPGSSAEPILTGTPNPIKHAQTSGENKRLESAPPLSWSFAERVRIEGSEIHCGAQGSLREAQGMR